MDVRFRRLERIDFPTLSEWFSMPHVEPWWREAHDLVSIEERYGPGVDGIDPTEVFVVTRGGRRGCGEEEIGLVQRYLLDDEPAWRRSLEPASVPHPAAGIDYLIGVEGLTGHGLGPAIIGLFVEDTWARHPQVVALVASVAQDNRRSWRALEKCGFVRRWSGDIVSEDPSDEGLSHVYLLRRPDPEAGRAARP